MGARRERREVTGLFEGVSLQGRRGVGRVVLSWAGGTSPLSYAYFPVWVSGKLHCVPIASCVALGGGWVVKGMLKLEEGVFQVEDVLTPRGNTVEIERTWIYRGGLLGNVRLGLDLHAAWQRLDFWAIPFISMNGNRGSKTVPVGMSRGDAPWCFREERTTAPGLMTLEADGAVVGSYTEPGRSEQALCACSILEVDDGHLLRTFFPLKETPRTFLGSSFPGDSRRPEQGVYVAGSGQQRGLTLEGKVRLSRRFYVVHDRAGSRRHGYVRVWESAWRNLKDPVAPRVPLRKLTRTLWKSIDFHWVSTGTVRGYVVRIGADGDLYGGFTPTIDAGWCGPTMLLGWLALRRAIAAGRASLAERPLQAVEFFLREAGLGNGLFRSHYNLKTRGWAESNLDAVQLGGAAYWLLRSVDLLKQTKLFERRIRASQWQSFALDFCDLAVRTQAANGAFGSLWSPDGACLATERTMGIHAARAVLEAYRQTGKPEYLRAAERGAVYYIRRCIDRESGYGDCTDLLSSTTENDGASVPDFYIDLYRVTGKRRYLDKAVKAAEYCLSFLFAYNVHLPPETECGRRGLRSRGLGAISPETGFLCSWFVLQSNAFLELWKETGEPRWKEYAVAVTRASLQIMTERGDTFGLAPHLVGCRAEVLPIVDTIKGGHVWKAGMTGYSWHQPVWWPAAFNLLNFALYEDRFPELLKQLDQGR